MKLYSVEKTYSWKSLVSGKSVDLNVVYRQDDVFPSKIQVVLKFATEFSKTFNLNTGDLPKDNKDPIRLDGRKSCVMILIPDDIWNKIQSDVKELKEYRDKYMESYLYPYVVNDTVSYGMYNGFSTDVEYLIRKVCDELVASKSDRVDKELCFIGNRPYDVVLKKLNGALKEYALNNYTPQEIQSNWCDEYKKSYQDEIKNKRAPGKALIPYSVVVNELKKVVVQCSKDVAGNMMKTLQETVKRAEENGHFSDVEATKKTQDWVDFYNEGCEGGYVPKFYTDKEYNDAKKQCVEIGDFLKYIDTVSI